MVARKQILSPALIGICGWILPGAGYWLIGQRARAITIGSTILILMGLGVLIGGIRIFDVPGYDRLGNVIGGQSWHPMDDLLNKPWYMGQILAGPVTIILSKASLKAAEPEQQIQAFHVIEGQKPPEPVEGIARSHARAWEIGVLYTAIAGMLNLLAIIDSCSRAAEMKGAPAK